MREFERQSTTGVNCNEREFRLTVSSSQLALDPYFFFAIGSPGLGVCRSWIYGDECVDAGGTIPLQCVNTMNVVQFTSLFI